MFVGNTCGVWFGFVEIMFCFAKSRKLSFQAKTTVIPSYIHLRTMEVVSHVAIIKDSVLPCCSFFWSKEFMSLCVRSVFPGHRFSFCQGNYFHHTKLNAATYSIEHNTPQQDTSSRSQCVPIHCRCLIPSASETELWCIFR